MKTIAHKIRTVAFAIALALIGLATTVEVTGNQAEAATICNAFGCWWQPPVCGFNIYGVYVCG